MTLGTNVPPPVAAVTAAAQHAERGPDAPGAVRTRRYMFGFVPLLGMLVAAALVGAGAALLVARATGWAPRLW